ncbi:2'-5' RNA ligase family protein [Halocatena marina]|uniref:2'-5' RNA ligase family protein n=1 Tax=Halocatena marina TaxID=2934937 RepID=UPI00200EAA1D|nr:2'-5' RNA ligase family protein [Halocatena marina]
MSDTAVASDEAEFWERRHELVLSPTTAEDVERRSTESARHLVLLAHITDEAIIRCFESIVADLDEFDCIVPIPVRDLHITVKVFGNVVEEPDGNAEFSQQDEKELATSLRSALGAVPSFPVRFPRFNLFPSVVYAEVTDDGRFSQLNQRVCAIPDVPVWDRDGDGFIPHLTLGEFTQRDGYEQLLQYLEDNHSLDIPPTTISELEFVALDLSNGRFPPYETIETYSLARRSD